MKETTQKLLGALGALLLLFSGAVVNAQTETQTAKTSRAHPQVQQSAYKEYRGVRLGMAATDARAKLGVPAMQSDEQDFYVLSPNETAQVVYDAAHKVVTISTDYTAGVGAPDATTVVGTGLLTRPDGSLFRMVHYDADHFWVSYNKSSGVVPVVTITIQAMK